MTFGSKTCGKMARRGTGTVSLDPSALQRENSASASPAGSAAAASTTRRNRRGSNAAAPSPGSATVSLAGNAIANAYLSLIDLTSEYDALLQEANLLLAVRECQFGVTNSPTLSTGEGICVEPPSTTAAARSHRSAHGSSSMLKKSSGGVGHAIRADMAAIASETTALLRQELRSMSHDRLIEHCVMLHAVILGTVRRGGLQPSFGQGPASAVASRGSSVAAETQPSLTFDESMLSTSYAPVRTTRELIKSIEEDGTKLINNYIILDELGRGSCGKVKLAFDPVSSSMVAIKIVRRRAASTFLSQQERSADAALEREIAVMKKLRHKNIVSLYEVIDDPEACKLYLVMQHVDDGAIGVIDPHTYTCDAIPGEELLDYARQILAGLEYLHSRDVIHRDIKPENILISKDGQCFLADFGVSEMFERNEQVVSGIRGTRLFMAPELLRSKAAADENANSNGGAPLLVSGRAVDMWALGVTLYALLLGHLPFTTEDEIISKGNPELSIDLDRIWTQLLRGMLDRDARTRITAKAARAMVKEAMHLGRRTTKEGTDLEPWSCTAEDINTAITPLVTSKAARRQSVGVSPPAQLLSSSDPDGDHRAFASIPVALDTTAPTLDSTATGPIPIRPQQSLPQFLEQERSVGSRTNLSGSTAAPSPSFAGLSSRRLESQSHMTRGAESRREPSPTPLPLAAKGGPMIIAASSCEPPRLDAGVDMSVVAARVAETHRMAQEAKMKLTKLVEEQRRVESNRLSLKPYPV